MKPNILQSAHEREWHQKNVIHILLEALKDAQDHLEYCGYGDAWERECALTGTDPLDKKIAAAIALGEQNK